MENKNIENSQSLIDIELKIENAKTPKEKIDLYIEYRGLVHFFDPAKALEALEKALKLALEIKDRKSQHLILLLRGLIFIEKEQYDKALTDHLECKRYAIEVNDSILYSSSMGNIAVVFSRVGLINQAIYIYKDLMMNHTPLDAVMLRQKHMSNLIKVYQKNFKYNEYSYAEIQKLLVFSENLEPYNLYFHILCLKNLAIFYKLKGEYNKSLSIYQEILTKTPGDGQNQYFYYTYIDIAFVYKHLKHEKNMYEYFQKALKISKKYHIEESNALIYEELSHYYKSKRKFDKALEFHEKFHEYQTIENEKKNRIQKTIESIGFHEFNTHEIDSLNNFINENIYSLERTIYEETIKGVIVKIYVDSIISVQLINNYVKLNLTGSNNIYIKKGFKEFVDELFFKFNNHHLFFYSNLRNEVINLYWFSKLDKTNKIIHLNALGEESKHELTRSQYGILKDFLNKI